jgi:hypothetical protein
MPGKGSLCQSALAAFLFSPAGLLALVAVVRHRAMSHQPFLLVSTYPFSTGLVSIRSMG